MHVCGGEVLKGPQHTLSAEKQHVHRARRVSPLRVDRRELCETSCDVEMRAHLIKIKKMLQRCRVLFEEQK